MQAWLSYPKGSHLCRSKLLNESVLREVHPLPNVDATLARLSGAKMFSKLGALASSVIRAISSTTFLAPWGRYAFNKLPFGISSAPEHFQKMMIDQLTDIEGI